MSEIARSSRRLASAAGVGLAALFLSSGCVTVTLYQPLVSLQRPAVVDPQAVNFPGDHFFLRCFPGEAMSPAEAGLVCRKVAAAFRNQGAEVSVEVPTRRGTALDPELKPDLVMELRARKLYAEDSSPWLLYFSIGTLTLVPYLSEEDFACEVTIRDASGFLLASDTLQARFVNSTGIGIWAVNAVLDYTVRPEAERVTGDGAKRAFSKDYYRQLSQLALDAKMRAQVLRGFSDKPDPGGK